ncbi:MAG: gamma carbonic anhydrase family protein [Nitrospirae bacterium]|nr:gamma carbonic anhydrase family protein [Nitrospirota bacterium]
MPILPYKHWIPKVPEGVFVAPNAYVIGNVELGSDTGIWFGVTIRGDVNAIAIGARTNIQDGTVIHATKDLWTTRVGANVTVGHAAVIHGCTIADNVLVGMRSVVLDGAEIGEYCFIAAGALVTPGTKIPPRSLVMGMPAKVVRPLKPSEIQQIDHSATSYIRYAKDYLERLTECVGEGLQTLPPRGSI